MLGPDEKQTPWVRGTTKELDARARELRRSMTPAEERLWAALRGRRLGGLKFRAQHAVGTCIFDFYCPALRLVVEVDGDVHDQPDQATKDEVRTEHLVACGYQVIRFHNEEVLTDLPSVLRRILEAAGRQ